VIPLFCPPDCPNTLSQSFPLPVNEKEARRFPSSLFPPSSLPPPPFLLAVRPVNSLLFPLPKKWTRRIPSLQLGRRCLGPPHHLTKCYPFLIIFCPGFPLWRVQKYSLLFFFLENSLPFESQIPEFRFPPPSPLKERCASWLWALVPFFFPLSKS